MTGYNKVFLDTTPLIYFLDSDVNFGEKTKKILEEVMSERKEFITSAITCMEYMVHPYRTKNQDKIDAFFEFMGDCEIPIKDIDIETAKAAAAIRAEYKDFKAMDSLQLAVALQNGCDLFLTNDNQLRQFKQMRCITVEEWHFEMMKKE